MLVIGESAVVRAGLEAALESGRFEVVGTCDLSGSPAMLESTGADAVFMDTASFGVLPAREQAAERNPAQYPSVALTPREIEVLGLVAGGASNKIIAHRLRISDHTVKFHVTYSFFRK